jgi:hypothetical protein
MPARRQRYWPLPGVGRVLPPDGTPGSFWEDRGDRCHGGLDLYAPPGSPVAAIEDGTVLSAGVFTSPDLVPYWNRTFEVTISHHSGIFCRYAELGDISVEAGFSVRGGEVIGHVGEVLDLSRIGPEAPRYIRSLKERGHGSMLHIEAFSAAPGPAPGYLGGNWFTRERPAHLLDPALVLGDAA